MPSPDADVIKINLPIPMSDLAKGVTLSDGQVVYYHGGQSGLATGDHIQCPFVTGRKATARHDKVYLTTIPELAAIFAAWAPGTKHFAAVYEVEPMGAIEPDNTCLRPGMSFMADEGVIKKVIILKKPQIDAIRLTCRMP